MTAKELMTTKVLAIMHDDYARHAVEIMAEHGISGMPVVDEAQNLVGIVSERDLLLIDEERPPVVKSALYGLYISPDRLVERDAERRGLRIRDVMTRSVITFGPDDKVSEVARTMHDRNINRVPIVQEGKLVGIISRHDIIRALAEGQTLG